MPRRLLVATVSAAIAASCSGDPDGPAAASSTGTPAGGASASSSVATSTGAGAAPPTRAPGMTDLSILFPLPATAAGTGDLLGADAAGAYGELLPTDVFSALGQLGSSSNTSAVYASLRVVSARLDPCFPKMVPGEPCRAQIRLVFQPIDTTNGVDTLDAAVHVFFDVPDDELVTMLGATTSAQPAADASGPLSVHPAMAKEGLGGPATTAIESAILARAGRDRLSRVTSMRLGGNGNVWMFGGFDVANGELVPLGIAGSSEYEQDIENNAPGDPLNIHGDVFPIIAPDDLGALYESNLAETMTDDELFPLYESALRAQNPAFHTADSVACATCHAANAFEKWIDRNTGLSGTPTPARFVSNQDLSQPSDIYDERIVAFRAFGYQGTTPAVSARVIAETALLVDHYASIGAEPGP